MNVMKIMQNKNSSYFLIIILTIVFATSVNAGVLFGQSFDKEKITTNEVAFFNITIYNDNNYEIKDYLRLESSENISFIDSEDKIILQEFGPIKPFEKEVVKIRIKANNTKKNEGIIYGYYGIDPNGEASYAFVGRIGVESKPIFVEGKTEKKLTDTGEIISTDFKMFNSSKEALHNVAFEVSAPNGFEIRTAPIFFETVEAGETITGNFEIYPPIEAIGEQKIILNYGYFDANGPHYFEQNFSVSFQQNDSRLLLGIVGLIVLIVAVFLYIGKNKSQPKIKGTHQKAEEKK